MPIADQTDLLLPADPGQRALARELYALAAQQPIISPHGHVDPALLAQDQPFPDPARLLIVPDHYLTRMLLSQGVPPAQLGVPTRDGSPAETDGRVIWRRFAAHWHLFRGTPSRLWLERTFRTVFGVDTPLRPSTADDVYDELAARLAEPDFRPRALFERFNIEVLATTESPLDDLGQHAKLAADGWGGPGGRVVTTFRPDDVVDMEFEGWSTNVQRLGALAGEDTGTYAGYLAALRSRRAAFIAAGATSSDHGHPTARTLDLAPEEAARLYDRGLRGEADAADAEAFRAHMLVEFRSDVARRRPRHATAPRRGPQPQPVAVRPARPRRRRRHPAGHRVRARARPAVGALRQRQPAAGGALHPRRGHLHP